jgi:hypothetical protein
MIFQRYIGCHHPEMEWSWFETVEQFHAYIAADEEGRSRPLSVRLSLDDHRNPEPRLVNASNGLLHPTLLPIMVQLLEKAYDYWIERHPEEVTSEPVP